MLTSLAAGVEMRVSTQVDTFYTEQITLTWSSAGVQTGSIIGDIELSDNLFVIRCARSISLET